MEKKISTFADRYMKKIDGQQMLPASVFRSFLAELAEILEAESES